LAGIWFPPGSVFRGRPAAWTILALFAGTDPYSMLGHDECKAGAFESLAQLSLGRSVDIVSLALVVAHGAARHARTIGKVGLGPV
jgi:hypothetical protein